MDDKRLREIEEHLGQRALCCGPCSAKGVDAEWAWRLRESVDEIRRLRGMVDGLLDEHPWSHDDYGTVCGYCGNERRGEFSCPAHQCAWASAMQQRDWKPEEAKREDTGA